MPKPLVEIQPYALPDADLLQEGVMRVLVWRVPTSCVVVGQSNRVLDSLDLFALARDQVPVFRRPSGGQPVFLSPRTLQISVLLDEPVLTNPRHHFDRINHYVAMLVKKELGLSLHARGISDLATVEGLKVLGSSIYRSQGRVLYHGVLNLAESPACISRYLLHPPQEPDYRKGRSHEGFITSLAELVSAFRMESFLLYFSREMPQLLF